MKKIFFIFLFLIISVNGYCKTLDNLVLKDYVTDLSNKLSTDEINKLNEKLKDFYLLSSNQIAILLIPSLEGKEIEDFSIDIARRSGIGTKEHSNGILITIAMKERKTRIEVGYGLEGAYPDIYAKRALDDAKVFFKKGNFYDGLNYITNDIIDKTSKEYSKEEVKDKEDSFSFFIFFIIIAAIMIFLLILDSSKGSSGGGFGSGWSSGGSSSGSSGGGGGSFGGGGFGGGGASGGF